MLNTMLHPLGYIRSTLAASCLCLLTFSLLSLPAIADEKSPGKKAATNLNVLERSMKSLGGETVDLQKYKGKVLLIVNTASECGLTPQYTQLQAVFEKYKDQGLVVLGFPCNQFGKQEPGTAKEISEFCTKNYGVTFDMFDKVDVNGESACDLYKSLTAMELEPKGTGKVSWNFEKFLVNRDGQAVARFEPRTAPDDEEVTQAIEKLLAK
jgi:glutathione peroxidase